MCAILQRDTTRSGRAHSIYGLCEFDNGKLAFTAAGRRVVLEASELKVTYQWLPRFVLPTLVARSFDGRCEIAFSTLRRTTLLKIIKMLSS